VSDGPDEFHLRLKARAALAGMSLSDYLLGEISRSAERPTLDEVSPTIAGPRRSYLGHPAIRGCSR